MWASPLWKNPHDGRSRLRYISRRFLVWYRRYPVVSVVLTKGRGDVLWLSNLQFSFQFLLVRRIVFGGVVAWARNMNTNEDGTQDVKTRKFPVPWVGLSIVPLVWLLWGLLSSQASAQPYTDAATNVMALFAQIMMVKRYREQWIWWIVIDLFCIKMWWVAGNWSMVAMYIAWTITASMAG